MRLLKWRLHPNRQSARVSKSCKFLLFAAKGITDAPELRLKSEEPKAKSQEPKPRTKAKKQKPLTESLKISVISAISGKVFVGVHL
jgi:hypothetical protein